MTLTISELCDHISNISKENSAKKNILSVSFIETPIGSMVAMSDKNALYLLDFLTKKYLFKEVEFLNQKGFSFNFDKTSPLLAIESELQAYFKGTLKTFKTPYRTIGSPFQKEVWETLSNIPFGETMSYAEESNIMGRPSSYRACANANGKNRLAIIIPCHRVRRSDGTLGGYAGGIPIKKWLIEHEKRSNRSDNGVNLTSCRT